MSIAAPPFTSLPLIAGPHGVIGLVRLPDSADPVPEEVLGRLHPEEAEYARALRGYRQVSFVGGRLALADALATLGVPRVPVLPDERGTPILPDGLTGSISHKRTLAVGLAALAPSHVRVGIDLEDLDPPRPQVAPRVLRPAELSEIAQLPEDRRWIDLVIRFSAKEAIYKAIDPFVRRWVGFDEASVEPQVDGTLQLALHLTPPAPGLEVTGRFRWLPGHVLTTVRATRRQPG